MEGSLEISSLVPLNVIILSIISKKNKFEIRLFYSWSMTLSCKEIHVDLTVLSVFQKAVTFDHNFT